MQDILYTPLPSEKICRASTILWAIKMLAAKQKKTEHKTIILMNALNYLHSTPITNMKQIQSFSQALQQISALHC